MVRVVLVVRAVALADPAVDPVGLVVDLVVVHVGLAVVGAVHAVDHVARVVVDAVRVGPAADLAVDHAGHAVVPAAHAAVDVGPVAAHVVRVGPAVETSS